MRKIHIFLLAFLFLGKLYAQTEEQLNLLDKYYQKTLDEWHIPGMAVAITNGDKILFSKGYGYADLEKKTKVDGNTLFAIASNSKAFTATSIAQLIEEKRLNWSDKVIGILPYYRLYNDYTTQHTMVEDLMTHRNGLKTFSGDLLWFATTKTPEEIIAGQQYLKPVYEFRTKFGYSNIGYLTAGKVLEKVTDSTWVDYVSTHFLKPLQMNRTLTSVKQIPGTKNIASPYFYEDGRNYRIDWTNWDNIAPAGALISSVNDYSKWLQLNLNKGKLNGKTYFSESTFNKLTTPQATFQVGKNDEKVSFKGYGMGWSVQDYQGYKIVGHGGGYDGMISKSTFVPEKGIGIIVLTNSLNWAASAVVNKTLDVLLAGKTDGKDWSANYLKYKNDADKKDKEKSIKDENLRGKLGKDHLNYSEYAGTYTDKNYGDVVVSETRGKLYFRMVETPIYKAELNHWNHNIFTFRFDKKLTSLPQGKLWFDLDKNGKVEKLHIDVPNPDFFFTEFKFIKQ
jgi:CubicO group peptidase (beta-lactamase class C family)